MKERTVADMMKEHGAIRIYNDRCVLFEDGSTYAWDILSREWVECNREYVLNNRNYI